jgi:AcrR family transcriptional regulator
MARRSDHTRRELYNLVLNKAQMLVESQGFQSLTARAVAQAVGYSPGTLYNLFANLDELVVHLNARTLERLEEALRRVRNSGDPKTDIQALARAYLDFLKKNPRLWEMLFEYRLGEETTLPDWFLARIQGLLAHVEAALAPLFKSSEKKKRADAALVLWASLHGIGSLAADGKLEIVTAASANHLTEMLVSNFVRGLAATH